MDFVTIMMKIGFYIMIAPFAAIYLAFTMPLIGIPACIVVFYIMYWWNNSTSGYNSFSSTTPKDPVAGQFWIRESKNSDGTKSVNVWRVY